MVAGALAAAAFGCGAQDVEGPPAPPHPAQCRSLTELAPALNQVLQQDGGKLGTFINRNKLLDPKPDGSQAPLMVVVGLVLSNLSSMGQEPEAGAPGGQLCNLTDPPAARDANQMCELRRIIKKYVREGNGLDALHAIDPVVGGTLGYIIGAKPGSQSHYKVADALGASCQKASCKTEDLLDMLTGILSFIEPTKEQPKRHLELLAQLNDLLNDPRAQPMMQKIVTKMSQDDFVGIARVLIDNILNFPTDPAQFAAAYHRDLEIKINDLLTSFGIARNDPQWADLRVKLDAVLGPHEGANDLNKPHGNVHALLYDLLDPTRPDPVLKPMQGELACMKQVDPDFNLVRMTYDLAIVDDVLGIKNLMGAIQKLAEKDDRLSILSLAKNLIKMIRKDELGTRATREICVTALETQAPAPGEKSNAELLLSVAYDLETDGVMPELICVVDTLLFGCAGGTQPACSGLK